MKNYVCAHCGGSNITFDANAIWSTRLQDHILTGVMDNSVCEDCSGECNVKEVDVPPPEANPALLTEEQFNCIRTVDHILSTHGLPSFSELRDALSKADIALTYLEDHAPHTAMDRLRMAVTVYERIPKAEED